ncbi:MAG: GIY-YIG nuclease family protein [Sphingopyxis terrae]|nr:GIY-YIG nuclease family protein [Sphingopyxis terrae]
MSRTYHVYILASGRNGTLYTGVTGDLAQRMEQHRDGEGSKFTTKYGVTRLVHIEVFADVNAAIAREKAVKKWRRAWKLELIERGNPQWLDLYDRING